MIIRYALLEGLAFFNIVVFFLEHSYWSLGVVALSVLVMLVMFPTQSRVEHWLQDSIRQGESTR